MAFESVQNVSGAHKEQIRGTLPAYDFVVFWYTGHPSWSLHHNEAVIRLEAYKDRIRNSDRLNQQQIDAAIVAADASIAEHRAAIVLHDAAAKKFAALKNAFESLYTEAEIY